MKKLILIPILLLSLSIFGQETNYAIDGNNAITGTIKVGTIAHETTDVDKFLVVNADLMKYRTGAEMLSDIMAYPGAGIALSTGSAWGTSITNNSTNWNTAYDDRMKWDGGATGLTAATGRTSLGATTVGSNLFTLPNPSAIRFLRLNAANTTSALNAADFRTAIGAGTSSTVGTVTSVGFADGTGFTISGSPITSSGSFTFAQDFSEFTDITESTGIKFVVTDPAEKEITIGNVDLSDFNNDAFANKALSNLSSVAINTTLLPGTTNSIALGSAAKNYSDLYIGSGGTINWDDDDANLTLTQSVNTLTLGGGSFSVGSNNVWSTGFVGRDVDNRLDWSGNDTLKIKIAGVNHDIVSISTGTADNDKLITQGYVNDADDGKANTGLNNLSNMAINASLIPGNDNSITLGQYTKQFAGLHLGTGSQINWDGGSVDLTHSAGLLTLSDGNLSLGDGNLFTTGYVGRDVDNKLDWKTDNHLAIKIAGTEHDIVSISTGTADNDKLITEGYVTDAIKSLNLATSYQTANYTITTSNNVVIFTNTAIVNDTCTLPDLSAGKSIWIRRGDTTNDVVITANDLTTNGLSNLSNYNMTGTVQSCFCVQEGTGAGYQWNIIQIGN